jgi:hypothetical protein
MSIQIMKFNMTRALACLSPALLCLLPATGFAGDYAATNDPSQNVGYEQAELEPGATVKYSDDKNMPFRLGKSHFGSELKAIPTFHSLGLYWATPSGGSSQPAYVFYRQAGTDWKFALPLWYDGRNKEYRGSIVKLTPGATYEVLAWIPDRMIATTTVATWNAEFPIAKTVHLPRISSVPYDIKESGTPGGYVLYTADPAGSTIDMGADDRHLSAYHNCVNVQASYVIVRGLNLRNCQRNGVGLQDGAHHVVIEENDISGFGSGWAGQPEAIPGPTGLIRQGYNEQAGVSCWNYRTAVERKVHTVVVQRNRIHDPRYGSQHWAYGHPNVTNAVGFYHCGSNNVVRYNDISAIPGHYFNDGIGGSDNFTFEGFPYADSDIYGNRIAGVYDDGIEAEGANRNVRIWGNFIEQAQIGIAAATTSIGPLYVFGNVMNNNAGLSRPFNPTPDSDDRGSFFKVGSRVPKVNGGRMYFFHNTALQPKQPPGLGIQGWMGVAAGIDMAGGDTCNIVSRNNILPIWKPSRKSAVRINAACGASDIDHELTRGGVDESSIKLGSHILTVPTLTFGLDLYAVDPDSNVYRETRYDVVPVGVDPLADAPNKYVGKLYLSERDASSGGNFRVVPGSPAYQAGQWLPYFNDMERPDIGAQQQADRPMEFGVDAYRPKAGTAARATPRGR